MNRKEAFRRWLQNEKVKKTGKAIPERIIESYIKEISYLSDTMYENGVINKRLYSMATTKEVDEAVAAIKRHHEYINMNQASDNRLHKALEQYLTFSAR